MPPADARAGLAARQAELLRALLGETPAPAGFDADRVRATAGVLARKRARAAARAWPALAAALGYRFERLFAAFADANPLPAEGAPLADGRAFARCLAAAGELPDEGRLEALAVDLHYRTTPGGLRPRRGSACKLALLRRPRRLVVALRLPWLGERWLTVPLGLRRGKPKTFQTVHPARDDEPTLITRSSILAP